MAINQERIMMKKIVYKIDNFYEVLFSGNFIAYILTACNPLAINSLKDLNDSARELERLGRDRYGPSYKLHRYHLIDFFI